MTRLSMDTHGFLTGPDGKPPSCTRCGTQLQGDMSGRPAESYAGTFTGLCYPCTNAGDQVVATLGPLRRISAPPHCPSWRRDREEYWADPACGVCRGTGRTTVYRGYGSGGPYPVHCERCSSAASWLLAHRDAMAGKSRPSWYGMPSRFAAPPKFTPAERKAQIAAAKAAKKAGASFDWDDPPTVVLWDWLEPSLRLPQTLHDMQEAS